MNTPPVIDSDWLRFAPLLLTILGWYFVNKQSNVRETRKEHRALLDAAKKQVSEIAANAQKYLQDADSKLAPDIKWALDALEIEFCRIPEYSRTSEILLRFVNFSDACTGGEFEQAQRGSLSPDSAQAQAVIQARNDLLETLERWFRNRYT